MRDPPISSRHDVSGAGGIVNNGIMAGGVGIVDSDSNSADTSYVFNYGVLAGISDAFYGGSGADRQVVNNYGGVSGSIQLGSGFNDVVYNAGIIDGNVSLGNGAGAVYNGVQGQIIGDVFAGSGFDTIFAGSGPTDMFGGSGADALIGGAGTDAIFVGSGNDHIQAGSGLNFIGFEPSSIVANHFDDVANFGPSTYLTLPSADLFTTAFVAFNGGTVVAEPVGGAFFGIFVGGVAPSTVRAHTLFDL